MRNHDKPKKPADKDPVLPAYDEGKVESVGEGRGQGRDDDPRTGQASRPRRGGQEPKLSDQRDRFISSEVADEAGPSKTTG